MTRAFDAKKGTLRTSTHEGGRWKYKGGGRGKAEEKMVQWLDVHSE